MTPDLSTQPLTPDRWDDFERLMGPRGGADDCWCMLWRLRAKDWREGRAGGNRTAMRAIVSDEPPGLLAYTDGQPVGWCSVAPRTVFPRLDNSRILKPVDDTPVWSVTCFFIAKGWRRKGVATTLLDAACDFARDHGAKVLEGYPIDPLGERYANAFAWTGMARSFEALGFEEVARRSDKRPIMRKTLV